jgi:hypothetical protein
MPRLTTQRSEPSKIIEAGSGTGVRGPSVSKMAPLLAVAIQSGVATLPSFKKATMYDAIGKSGLMFRRGFTLGFPGP